MASHTTYFYLDIILPLILLQYLPVIYTFVLYYLLFHHRCMKTEIKMSTFSQVCIKGIFQDFKLKPSEAGRKMVLQQQVLPYDIAYLLLAVVAGIYGCAIITFWNRFLIHESSVCDLNFDCFKVNDKGEDVTRLDNCFEFENVTSFTVNGTKYEFDCFRFALDYTSAVESVGGFLSFAIIAAKIYVSLIFMIKGKSKTCKYLLSFLFFGSFAICWLVFIFLVIFVPAISDILLSTLTDIIQLVVYAITLVTVYITAGVLFITNTPPYEQLN